MTVKKETQDLNEVMGKATKTPPVPELKPIKYRAVERREIDVYNPTDPNLSIRLIKCVNLYNKNQFEFHSVARFVVDQEVPVKKGALQIIGKNVTQTVKRQVECEFIIEGAQNVQSAMARYDKAYAKKQDELNPKIKIINPA